MTSINLGLRDGFLSILIKKVLIFSTSSSWKFNECLKRGGIAAAAFAAKSITWRQVHYHRCIIKAFTLTSYRIYIFFPFYLCPSFPKVGGTPLYETTFSCALALSPFTFFFIFLFEMVESIREQREARKIWSRAARTNLGENHHNRWLNS